MFGNCSSTYHKTTKKKPPVSDYDETDDYRADLADVVPYESIRPYDVRRVVEQVVDADSFMEVQPEFARNIVVGLSRIKGETVGLVCNQPRVMAGGLDIDSSDKAARFIRFCDAFNIPIITFEDVTGFFPGIKQEARRNYSAWSEILICLFGSNGS